MQGVCDGIGKDFCDVWSMKDKAIAQNWLKLCKREGIDPKDLLKKVCMEWVGALNDLFDDYGRRIVLPSTVSFTKFIQFRKYIEPILLHVVARSDEDSDIIEMTTEEAYMKRCKKLEEEEQNKIREKQEKAKRDAELLAKKESWMWENL
jgi:hypothetical protein